MMYNIDNDYNDGFKCVLTLRPVISTKGFILGRCEYILLRDNKIE